MALKYYGCHGSLIWLIFGGFLAGLGYILGGLLTCLTVVGIPFGAQSIKLGIATMTPFGREIVPSENAGGTLEVVFEPSAGAHGAESVDYLVVTNPKFDADAACSSSRSDKPSVSPPRAATGSAMMSRTRQRGFSDA